MADNTTITITPNERKILDGLLNMVADSDYYVEVRPTGMTQKQCDAAAKSLLKKLVQKS